MMPSGLELLDSLPRAKRSSEVYAAFDFARASFMWAKSPPLRARLLAAARKTRVPIYFVQAENDHDTTPSLALAAEAADAGKRGVAE
jgi:hypothetical protein